MKFEFNSLNLVEPPKIAILRQDLKMLGFLNAKNIVIKPAFANISELTFKCYKSDQFYDCLIKGIVFEVDGFGRFVQTEASESKNSDGDMITVTAHSWEETLNNITLTYNDNTHFKLWDAITPESGSSVQNPDGSWSNFPTLLYVIQKQTGWKIAHVDAELLNESRTMSIDKEQVYSLLMSTIADTYKCYFEFDTLNKEISCYSKDENTYVPKHTGINVSFNNILQEQTISESSDDIITALTIKGADGVGISLVNPLGNDVVYDFSYYMNNKSWGMDKDLQDAIKAWENKKETSSEEYGDLISKIRDLGSKYIDLDSELSILKSELKSLQDVQSVNIAANNKDELKKDHDAVEAKQAEIVAKQAEITANQNESKEHKTRLTEITTSLSFENNFTKEQLESLQYFVNGSVYENSNFVFTTNMPEYQKLDIENSLYKYGRQMLDKMSRPLYQYSCKILPFMFDKKYAEFTKNILLGGAVNLEKEPGVWVEPRILSLNIDYDNPDNTTMILSDTFRLMDNTSVFSNGFNQAVKASRKQSLSAPLWDEPNQNNFYGSVTDYINNALDLTRQEIVNATNQEITMGSYGLRAKKWDSELEKFDDHQVALTSNVLAFTDDNWQSCRAALGKVELGEGHEYYGLVAEALVGEMIAGSSLTIRNGNADGTGVTFKVDENGCSLENAQFKVYNNKSQILINPDDGFIMKKNENGAWKDVLTEDNDGNLIANSIKVKSGELGGWTIKDDGIYSDNGDTYLKKDGTGKISLMTYGYNDGKRYARFDGDIYANNLKWTDEKPLFVEWTDPNGVNPKIWAMSGSWLGYGSIDPTKRNVGAWDDIYATNAYIGKLVADYIKTDQITAGDAVIDGVTTKVLFGGKILVGRGDTQHVTLEYNKEYINTNVGDQDSISIHAAGNIRLDAQNGNVYTDRLNCNYFWTDQNATINHDLSINGGTYIKGDLHVGDDTGKTQTVVISGQELTFKNGILINWRGI